MLPNGRSLREALKATRRAREQANWDVYLKLPMSALIVLPQ